MSKRRLVALLSAFAVLTGGPARAERPSVLFDSLQTTDFASQRLGAEDLRLLELDELARLRGIVFGRHGRVFRNDGIQIWLEGQPWYRPDPAFRNASLNDIERETLDLIREAEALKHEWIEPGDLRWWQDRRMTVETLGTHSNAEWIVLRAEVEAVHGRSFDGVPWLQHYFDERYWYRADDRYDPGQLNIIERQNIALLDSLEQPQGGAGIAPCDMDLYEERPVTEDQLRGASFTTLRILRNEIYARRGMAFNTGWLAVHFADRPWYVRRDGVEPRLIEMDQRNVATIAAAERALRDALHSRPLDVSLLESMFVEDTRRLRLEIYARHGRVFRRRWMQDFVASRPGYRPDVNYSDAMLNDVERVNIASIVAYEVTAASIMDAVEG